MTAKSERLSVLSTAEQEALYGLPDFDDGQQLAYLSLSKTELALATGRPGFHAQVYCVLQIGYFKAKHAFFRFDWSTIENDCAFVLSRYFHGEAFEGSIDETDIKVRQADLALTKPGVKPHSGSPDRVMAAGAGKDIHVSVERYGG